MTLILLGLLLPLGFVFAGVWDGRDVIVIFWIETMFVFFFTVVRLALAAGESAAMRIGRACVTGVFLIFVWFWLGDHLSSDILAPPSRDPISNALRLLRFSLDRSGSYAFAALFLIYGIDIVVRRSRNKAYRDASADEIGKDMWKRILPLYFVPLFGSAPHALGNHFKATTAAVMLAIGLALFRIVFEIVFPWLLSSAGERTPK